MMMGMVVVILMTMMMLMVVVLFDIQNTLQADYIGAAEILQLPLTGIGSSFNTK